MLTYAAICSNEIDLELYNMQGQKILGQKIVKNEEIFSIELPANLQGAYLLRMSGDQTIHTSKIIVE